MYSRPPPKDFRPLKRAVQEKLPPGHPFRETVLALNDEVAGEEGAVLLQVLMRLLLTDREVVA